MPCTNLCVNMAQVHCERGQDKSALKYNDIVLRVQECRLDPMHSEVANALSNSVLSMVGYGQDLDLALQMLKRSLDTTPWVAAALHYKGDVRLRQGKTKDAT